MTRLSAAEKAPLARALSVYLAGLGEWHRPRGVSESDEARILNRLWGRLGLADPAPEPPAGGSSAPLP